MVSAATNQDVHPRSIAARFDPHDNGLNFIRLILAALVLVSHSWPLGGFGEDPQLCGANLGTVAVGGFFAISGFLITGSALRLPLSVFAWRRFLRIFPGYWLCLLITAFMIAPITSIMTGGWSMSAAGTYFVGNLPMVFSHFSSIGTTLDGREYPLWNGSLWTLRYEVACYALVGLAALLAVCCTKRWLTPLALAVATIALAVLDVAGLVGLLAQFTGLLVFFLAGASLLRYSGVIRLTIWGALIAGGALSLAGATGTFLTLAGIPLAYLLLWLARAMPAQMRAVGSRNDISYGVYLYGWPVQQLLVTLGMNRWGPVWLILSAFAVVVPFAAASWFVVERPSMCLKTLRARGRPAPSSTPAGHDPLSA